jgi:hypothetical protein
MKRVNIKEILQDPQKKRQLFVGAIQFLQNIEGIDTTKEQAETAYDKVQEDTSQTVPSDLTNPPPDAL